MAASLSGTITGPPRYTTIGDSTACSDRTEEIALDSGVSPIVTDMRSAGLARNAALELAGGEYLLFLDADDYFLSGDALQVIDLWLRHDPVDVLHFGFMMGPRLARPRADGGKIWVNVWSKAFRRSTCGDLRFTDPRTAEDARWLAEVVSRQVTHGYLDLPLVQYRYPRRDSLSDLVARGEATWDSIANTGATPWLHPFD